MGVPLIQFQLDSTLYPESRSLAAKQAPTFEFHVSRAARENYGFDDTFFMSNGNIVFADFQAAHLFSEKMNARRDLVNHPEQVVYASQINSLGLIDEMLHRIIDIYRQQVNPRVFHQAHEWLENKVGPDKVDTTLTRFVELFPPLEVYRGRIAVEDYLAGSTAGVSNKIIALEELLLLRLANMNPAFAPFLELFDDGLLRAETVYLELVTSLESFFSTQPRFGPGNLNLFTLLRQPAIERPFSLEEQLRYMAGTWGFLLGDFILRLLRGVDFLKEEAKPVFFGPPPTQVLDYWPDDAETEKFSPDLHWMPNLVLIAKSTLVWLDQLSRSHGRQISRLDQIPDEELDKLAGWGFTGLWLIGIWERSNASKKIKQTCGNQDAESSAYSLFDYQIAYELGGYAALQNLKERCWVRGIRVGCDMVPNHTGIDSRWMREHPDWFISLPFSPFPNYSFNGPNLSEDTRYAIQIEDNYYNQSDAAVVFRRQDYWTGDVRFIYHGNDGTNMPWNDTAQLDYLRPDVREAVIQKILDVARMFPIIRFDAAMTLAKRHFHRLWYPEPGGGGDIPSRSQFGMGKAALDQHLPNEFWREVVDRVAAEVPDCLLLAEAFWLMEGYFVRTLGMHRVYNSAFMNMLKNEENKKYRQTIINTLQFEPEILKRHVNFLSNPDEDTAIAQFGDGDKYFGACLLMVTMPGLPMFGHGQIEGLREKYGMEYRRAYWDEQVNTGLVDRHVQEIFPLLKKRYLFAEVENFLFYDFVSADGQVNDNVFAFSNRSGSESTVVVFHNKYEEARGWIRASVPFAQRSDRDGEPALVQKSLRQGLSLAYEPHCFLIFRDRISNLEYIQNCKRVSDEGLYFELQAYGRRVLTDMYQVHDDESGYYSQLHDYLNGRGVTSIAEELGEITFKPLLQKADVLLSPAAFKAFLQNRLSARQKTIKRNFLKTFRSQYHELLQQAVLLHPAVGTKTAIKQRLSRASRSLETVMRVHDWARTASLPQRSAKRVAAAVNRISKQDDLFWSVIYVWTVVQPLQAFVDQASEAHLRQNVLNDWLLGRRTDKVIRESGVAGAEHFPARAAVALLVRHSGWLGDEKAGSPRAYRLLQRLLTASEVRAFLKVNLFADILWFDGERFELFLELMFAVAVFEAMIRRKTKSQVGQDVLDISAVVSKWRKAEAGAEYQVEKLLLALAPKTSKNRPAKPGKSSRKKKVKIKKTPQA